MERIRKKVITIMQGVVNDLQLDNPDKYRMTFEELGIDSLDTMTIFLEIEENFDIDEIPEDSFLALDTIDKIVVYLGKKLD